ncbi:RNA-directed DNA polymerase, eukaryota, partial [Tanacetum coccineum]
MWIGDSRLCLVFPRLYRLENNKDCTVAVKMNDPFVSSLRRDVRGGVESTQLSQLRVLLDTVVSLNRLPTRINLVRRGVSASPIPCSICHAGLEDLDHLLFCCSMAIDVTRSI